MRRSFAVILLLTFLPASHAQLESSRDEATLKALFIYTFTKHIEWPEANNPNKQFVITIFGNYNLTGKLMSMLKGREMNGNKFVVVEAENVNAIQSSSIIFIASSKIESIKEIRERFKSQSVLIITEEVKFPAGSNINIVSRNDKLAFELNETDLKAQGLKVSHQLHDLAVKVY